jgi:succinoglycan biosynthesis transport protein ExoP
MVNSSPASMGPNQYWQIISKHRHQGSLAFLAVLTLGVIATTLKPSVYQADAKLKFKGNTASSSLTEVSKAIGTLSPIVDQGNPLDTESEVLRSVPMIKKTINDPELQLKDSEGKILSVDSFKKNLKVGSIVSTDILEVSYISEDPEEATKVVNTLIRNYLENNLAVNKAEAEAAKKTVEGQLPRVISSLHQTELAIRQLKDDSQYIDPEQDNYVSIFRMQEIRKDLSIAEGELLSANSQANYIRSELGLTAQQAVILANIGQSPEVKETILKLQGAESELAIAQARFTANSPNVIEAQAQASSLKKLLEKQTIAIGGEGARAIIGKLKTGEIQQKLTNELIDLETSSSGLRKKIANLKRTEQEHLAKMQQSPIVEQKLRVLTRELDSLDSTYKVLQQQLQNISNAESQDSSNIRVISNADIPSEPMFPRTVGYLASGSLAFLAATIVIYLSEVTGRSAKIVDEVKQIENYGSSALETIPEVHEIRYLTEEDIRRLTAEIVRLYSK